MLAESQQAALLLALLSKVPVITGGPGVGKINLILKVLGDQPADMTFCDPPC